HVLPGLPARLDGDGLPGALELVLVLLGVVGGRPGQETDGEDDTETRLHGGTSGESLAAPHRAGGCFCPLFVGTRPGFARAEAGRAGWLAARDYRRGIPRSTPVAARRSRETSGTGSARRPGPCTGPGRLPGVRRACWRTGACRGRTP